MGDETNMAPAVWRTPARWSGRCELQKYLDSLKLKRKTAAKYRTYLSSVLSSAIRLGHGLTYNPARFVKLPAEGPEEPYVMPTAEQVVAILDGLKGPRHKMAWQLAAWLGNGSGELRGLRWESVVWEHNLDPRIDPGREKHATQNQERLSEGRAYRRTDAGTAGVQREELSGCPAQCLGASWETSQAHRPGLANVKAHQTARTQARHSRTSLARPTALGRPGGIRTPDPRFRKPLLYPSELQAHA